MHRVFPGRVGGVDAGDPSTCMPWLVAKAFKRCRAPKAFRERESCMKCTVVSAMIASPRGVVNLADELAIPQSSCRRDTASVTPTVGNRPGPW